MIRYPRNIALPALILVLAACADSGLLPDNRNNPAQTQIPENPSNLQAKALSSSSAQISWDAVGGASGYAVERQSSEGYVQLALVEATQTTLSELSPATSYVFRVKAKNEAGSSSGAEVSLTTLEAPNPNPEPTPNPTPQPQTAPSSPVNFAAKADSATSATLTWEVPAQGKAETYTLQRGYGTNPTTWSAVPIDSPMFLTQHDFGLAPRQTYTYRMRANNEVGSSDWVSQSVTTPTAASPAFKTEELASNINVAWAMRFDPANSKRIYFTPRDSAVLQIHRIDLNTKVITPFLSDSNVAVRYGGGTESGILGMDLDPSFLLNHWAYVCYGYYDAANNRKVRISRLELDESSKTLRNEKYLVTDIPGGFYHNGCRVLYGPDNKLYITTGDGQYGDTSQNVDSPAGKTMRINPDGSIPSDNPYSANPTYTSGHRNPQGIAFHPVTGQLWSTEHGPQTRDEINILKPGKNYGWPQCIGTQTYGSSVSGPDGTFTCAGGSITPDNYAPSLIDYTPSGTIAPSNLIFYPMNGSAFPAWRGSLFFTTLRTGRLYRLETSGETITKQEILIDNTQGRLRDIVAGPDGNLYISTDPGRLLRLSPQ